MHNTDVCGLVTRIFVAQDKWSNRASCDQVSESSQETVVAFVIFTTRLQAITETINKFAIFFHCSEDSVRPRRRC